MARLAVVVALTLRCGPALAQASPRPVAADALTRWLVRNKKKALLSADCFAASIDRFGHEFACRSNRGARVRLFAADAPPEGFIAMRLSDSEGWVRAVLVYLPALDAERAREIQDAAASVVRGDDAVKTRADLTSRGALLTDFAIVEAVLAAQRRLKDLERPSDWLHGWSGFPQLLAIP